MKKTILIAALLVILALAILFGARLFGANADTDAPASTDAVSTAADAEATQVPVTRDAGAGSGEDTGD